MYGPSVDLSYIYAIGTGDGVLKIGRARDVAQRIASLQSSHHQQLYAFLAHPTPYAVRLEMIVHNLLDYCHVRGEWYRCHLGEVTEAIRVAELLRPRLAGAHLPTWANGGSICPNATPLPIPGNRSLLICTNTCCPVTEATVQPPPPLPPSPGAPRRVVGQLPKRFHEGQVQMGGRTYSVNPANGRRRRVSQ